MAPDRDRSGAYSLIALYGLGVFVGELWTSWRYRRHGLRLAGSRVRSFRRAVGA